VSDEVNLEVARRRLLPVRNVRTGTCLLGFVDLFRFLRRDALLRTLVSSLSMVAALADSTS
jgi:hypothetical protein